MVESELRDASIEWSLINGAVFGKIAGASAARAA